MITLRKFDLSDAVEAQIALYPNMALSQVRDMIEQWNEGSVNGRRFDMLAVDADGIVVGTVSMYEQNVDSVSFGIEISPSHRCRGIGTEAGRLALSYATESGYRKVVSQVRQDNAASIALHKSLGFSLTEATVNRKGKPVFLYEKDL